MSTLLLHGLGGDARQALDLLGPVLPSDTIAPDVRAHGTSPLLGGAGDFALDRLADELDAPRGALTLVGISMGAALALRIALRRPEDVRRLVLVRPAFTDRPLPDHLAVFPVLGELLARCGAEEAERLFRASTAYRAVELVSPRGAAALLLQLRAPRAAERAVRLVEIPRNRAFAGAAELASLTAPATIIAAPRDPVHPLEVAQLWLRSLPSAELVTVPARDDGPQRYARALRSAVAGALASPGSP